MDKRHTDRQYSRPLGHVPTLLAAIGLWWLILKVLPI